MIRIFDLPSGSAIPVIDGEKRAEVSLCGEASKADVLDEATGRDGDPRKTRGAHLELLAIESTQFIDNWRSLPGRVAWL